MMKYYFLLSLVVLAVATGNPLRGYQSPKQFMEKEGRMLTVEEVLNSPEIMNNLDNKGLTIEAYKALPEEEQRELQNCGFTPFPTGPTVSPVPSASPTVSPQPTVSPKPTSNCGSGDSGDSDDGDDDDGDDRMGSIGKFFIGVMHRLYGY